MSKEQEIMNYLHEKVFNPILQSDAPANIKSGINITIARMSKLSAEKMVQYFWSALSTDHAVAFAKKMKSEQLPRFEDVFEEFRDRFSQEWLSK